MIFHAPSFERDSRFREQLHLVPTAQRIDISDEAMGMVKDLLPTSFDYIRRFLSFEVESSEATRQKLTELVAKVAAAQNQLFQEDKTDQKRQRFLYRLVEKYYDRRFSRENYDNTTKYGLQPWINPDPARPRKVYVAPAQVGYHGLVDSSSIGINEELLTDSADEQRLVGVAHHELAHIATDKRDYDPNFILYLLELAEFAHKRSQSAP